MSCQCLCILASPVVNIKTLPSKSHLLPLSLTVTFDLTFNQHLLTFALDLHLPFRSHPRRHNDNTTSYSQPWRSIPKSSPASATVLTSRLATLTISLRVHANSSSSALIPATPKPLHLPRTSISLSQPAPHSEALLPQEPLRFAPCKIHHNTLATTI